MVKIYINDVLRDYFEKSGENSLIFYSRKNLITIDNPQKFNQILENFKFQQIIDEQLIQSIFRDYFPESLLSIVQNSSLPKESVDELKKTIDSLFYTKLEENTLINDLNIQNFVSFVLDEIIKSILIEYYFTNLQEGKLLTYSENHKELFVFELMNRYDFLSYYFSSFVHLLTVFLAIESDIFTRNILIDDNLEKNFLEEVSNFYNVIISAYSKLRKDLSIFRINIVQEKRIFPSKNVKIKYDCRSSLKTLLNEIDGSIQNLDDIIRELREHKEVMREKIKQKELDKRELIKEMMLFVTELIATIVKGRT